MFEGDARVDPMHARKLAAALQHATSARLEDRPILLRREYSVGHTARAVSRAIPLWLDQLGFFARQLGLRTAWRLPGALGPGPQEVFDPGDGVRSARANVASDAA